MTMQLTVTNAGRAAIVNASNSGTLPITVASVGITATAVTASVTATTLPGEIKRITDVSGAPASADTMHFIVRDATTDVYNMKSFAMYLTDGTLFAIYGQATDIIDKVAASTMLMAADVKFADIDATSITFGDTNFLNPPATTSTKGVVELATDAEAVSLVDGTRAVTPAALAAVMALFARLAGAKFSGPVKFGDDFFSADLSGGNAVLNLDVAATYLAYIRAGKQLEFVIEGARIFAANVGGIYLDKNLNVIGSISRAGNGVWDAGNDGAGSGLDADLLDGQQGAWYADVVNRLGFMPVQQGGGTDQGTNKIRLGWGTNARLKAQVDVTDLGSVVFDSNVADVWRASNDGAGSGLDADLVDGWQRDDIRDWNNLLNKPGSFPPSGFSQALSGYGYQVLPSGMTLQWGNGGHTDGSGSQPIVFPIEFPTACLTAQVSNFASGPPTAFHGSGNLSASGMTVYSSSTSGSPAPAGVGFRWLAIGF
jgi:hypothetical protein